MYYFSQDFIDFFRDLAQNNNKTWFHSNRKRYERSVKDSFYSFIEDLICQIRRYDPLFSVSPHDCILRINRDIRFSKEKSPYNLHCTAFVSPGGGKDKSVPGLFLRFSPESIGIMGGCYGPSKEQLHAIRTYIANNLELFQTIIGEENFVSLFGKIRGASNKRLPATLQKVVLTEPLIANKQFYFTAERRPELIMQHDLMEEVMRYWQAARLLNDFFVNALNAAEPALQLKG